MTALLTALAADYLNALLDADRVRATHLIMSAIDNGVTIKDLYTHVFQESQYEIGRRWESNQVSVAQEHYCTAATQAIMAQLYPLIFSTERVNKRMIATSVSGELHEIGMRMVADFFEMEGWDTYYIGANAPISAVISAIESMDVDVLCISATMIFHIRTVEELIGAVRSTDRGKRIKILVGGFAFNSSDELWKKVGADGFGQNAQEAIIKANELVSY